VAGHLAPKESTLARVRGRAALWVFVATLSVCAGLPAFDARAGETPSVLAVLSVSAADRSAVLREGRSAPQLRRVGDRLESGRYRVAKILPDSVVLRELVAAAAAGATLPALSVRVFVAGSDGVSRVERVETQPSRPPQQREVIPGVLSEPFRPAPDGAKR